MNHNEEVLRHTRAKLQRKIQSVNPSRKPNRRVRRLVARASERLFKIELALGIVKPKPKTLAQNVKDKIKKAIGRTSK